MKVVLAHKCFYKKGGAEVFFFEVGRVLKEHGHEVAYFSCNDEQNIESEWSKYFIDAPDFKASNPVKKIGALFSIPYNLEAKREFGKLLDDFKPDIVHCFNIMTHISPSIMVAARERKIPVVISHNDYKHICPNYQLYRNGETCEACKGHRYMNCIKYKCAHNSLAFSAASAIELYVHHWLKVYEKNVTLHLFSCDYIAQKTEEFWGRKIQKGKLINPFRIPPKPDYVEEGDYGLFFGRLIGEKGVDVLLKALAHVKRIPFVIIGNGPDEEHLKQMAQELRLDNVRFVGPKWGVELDGYLSRARFAAHKEGCVNFCMYGWHPFLIPFFLYLFPRKKTILSAHNYQAHSHSGYDMTKFFYKRYRYFHFHSKMQMDLFLKDYPNGKVFYTQMLPKDFGSPNGLFSLDKQKKKVLLAFGLIRKYKRLDLLIEAVNKLDSDNVLVLIAGYSGDFSGYEAMINDKSKFKCEIRLIDNAEIADMFTISDFLVLPYDDATQSGPSLIALNYGLPIIASDLPAFKELIVDGTNGYLFRKGSVESLSKVIDRALKLSNDELFILKNNQYSTKSKYIQENNPYIKFDNFINNAVLE